MNILTISSRAELIACRDQWNSVAGDRAFFSWDWNVNWFNEMNNKNASPLVIVEQDDDGNWKSVAPFFIDGRKLRMFGSGSACTDYANLFSTHQSTRQFADEVAKRLSLGVGRPGPLQQIDRIEIEGGGRNDDSLTYFCDQLAHHGFLSHETETEGAWKLSLPDDPKGLDTILNSSCRRKVRKARKRLAQEDVSIEFSNEENFDKVWQDFVVLHQARRNTLGEPGCFADQAFEQFLKKGVRSLQTRELATLFVIYKSQKPVASQLLLISEQTCMMYQSGAAPEFISEEPGYQAIVVALDYAIEQGLAEYDFLRGDENYKTKWNTTREPIISRRFVPKKLSARARHRSWVVSRQIKAMVMNCCCTLSVLSQSFAMQARSFGK